MAFKVVLCLALVGVVFSDDSLFKVGTGIEDMTGPVTEIAFMGYAFPGQTGHGLHMRLFARAFIFEDSAGSRVVYVNLDACMTMLGFKVAVVEALQKIYGDLYTHENVMLTGTHTHSGPGAFSWHLLYDISMFGFDKKHFNMIVTSVVAAIGQAHNNLKSAVPGPLKLAQGLLDNANANRSPSSYLANPIEERKKYERWGGDTDHNMTVLRIDNGSGKEVGMISWFAVHCTSMHNTNKLVSSDNKGYAEQLFEAAKNGAASRPGAKKKGAFVAAFSQSNEGDVSPNTLGAWCHGIVGGEDCSMNQSLCDGKNENCVSVGPAGFKDDFGSTRIIGERQFAKAKSLYDGASTSLKGKVDARHMWVDMSRVTVRPEFTGLDGPATTCRPAVGFSFAAGTTDGPGAFNFYQGDNCTKDECNPFWNVVKKFLKAPTKEQIECHLPKPILLDVGEIEPHPWVPTTLPLQIMQVGQLVIVAVPSEFTTMAGRRLRNAVQAQFAAAGQDVTVVVAGLANAYSQYTATFEEYQWQRYEAASTLYGPHQLAAYIQHYDELAHALATGGKVTPGTLPHNASYVNFDLQPPPLVDTHPLGKKFGDVDAQPAQTYARNATAAASFWGGNLRVNYLTGSSYCDVEVLGGDGAWTVWRTDAHWETKTHWKRVLPASNRITCEWDIPADAPAAQYRFVHRGHYKKAEFNDHTEAYQGNSHAFTVTQ